MPTPLHKEIRWFKQEIELCEQTIKEVEADASFDPSKKATLAKLQATLEVHREELAKLERKLSQGTEGPRPLKRAEAGTAPENSN